MKKRCGVHFGETCEDCVDSCEGPWSDSNAPCDISDPFADSNTSTYVVACLTEIRVSARNEKEALAAAAQEWSVGGEDVRKVSFRIEDPPGRCCR